MNVASYPLPRSAPLLQPDALKNFRLEGPISRVRLWNGTEAWLITRYDDVRAALLDSRLSESPKDPGYPMFSESRAALVGAEDVFITHTQGDEHKRLRRVMSRELTVKRVEAQRENVRKIIAKLIDDMVEKGSPLDFVSNFALALPSLVITELLGVPYEDHEFFEENSRLRVALDVPADVPIRATKELSEYFSRILRDKEKDPGDSDDILTRLARDHVATGLISHEQAVILAYTMVQAGHETTGNMLTLGTLLLLRNPDQLELMLSDPSLVKTAVEEMLRHTSVLQLGMVRTATEDLEIDGRTIRKGEGVFVMLNSANHDPSIYPDPDQFDVTRTERNHVAFSYGIHQCAGQQLARMEMQEVFSVLFQRLPNLRLAVPFEDLKFKEQSVVYGVDALPVTW